MLHCRLAPEYTGTAPAVESQVATQAAREPSLPLDKLFLLKRREQAIVFEQARGEIAPGKGGDAALVLYSETALAFIK